MLETKHWQRVHGEPIGQYIFKQLPSDFIVTENLGYELTGEGEHVFLWVEKQNLNTAFVAEQIAKFSGLPLRDVSYAGRKDKYALTKQWFGLYLANRQEPDWSKFALDGASILKITRNNKKLRTGALKGNNFKIVLRDVSDENIQALEERLQLIDQQGVPNYYGEQRFGQHRFEQADALPGNLALASKMLNGEEIRNRNKRSMAISALRSWLFNEYIHQRITQYGHQSLHNGDVMQLAGTNSFFLCEEIDETIEKRAVERDINITCPLWGKGFLHSSDAIADFERSVAEKNQIICEKLSELGLKQERRSMLLFASKLDWKFENNCLSLSFDLPAGCFATSILRELCVTKE